jgi:hypothetical protein
VFKTPDDLARAALELLHVADLTGPRTALELSAAILANHVFEWHCRHTKTKSEDARRDFEQKHPEWPILRQIANGTKHPYPREIDISEAKLREPEWEDEDFWHATVDRPTLFVAVGDSERSIYVMTYRFCHRYLEGVKAAV